MRNPFLSPFSLFLRSSFFRTSEKAEKAEKAEDEL